MSYTAQISIRCDVCRRVSITASKDSGSAEARATVTGTNEGPVSYTFRPRTFTLYAIMNAFASDGWEQRGRRVLCPTCARLNPRRLSRRREDLGRAL